MEVSTTQGYVKLLMIVFIIFLLIFRDLYSVILVGYNISLIAIGWSMIMLVYQSIKRNMKEHGRFQSLDYTWEEWFVRFLITAFILEAIRSSL